MTQVPKSKSMLISRTTVKKPRMNKTILEDINSFFSRSVRGKKKKYNKKAEMAYLAALFFTGFDDNRYRGLKAQVRNV